MVKELPIIQIPRHCFYCQSRKITRVKNRIGNGAFQVWDMCVNCERHAWGRVYYIPHKQAGMPLEEIPLFQDYMKHNPPCVVCHSREGTELHHFAPRHIFGTEEAERWPKEYLCVKHHRVWHESVAMHYQEDCLYCKGLVTKGRANALISLGVA